MKSVRLDPHLEERLREAARALGVPESAFIREAIAARCESVLKDRLDTRLADVVGIVAGGGGRARATGDRFRELVGKPRSPR